jgi:hypothetical protein
MSDAKRWGWEWTYYDDGEMVEALDGEYVLASDYEALKAERDALKVERDALEERCRDLLFEIKMVHS